MKFVHNKLLNEEESEEDKNKMEGRIIGERSGN
jgi:hypothetical protein